MTLQSTGQISEVGDCRCVLHCSEFFVSRRQLTLQSAVAAGVLRETCRDSSVLAARSEIEPSWSVEKLSLSLGVQFRFGKHFLHLLPTFRGDASFTSRC